MNERFTELDGRWRFVAFTWGGVIALNALILWRLLSLPGKKRRRDKTPAARPSSVAEPLAGVTRVPAPPLSVASLPDELFEVEEEIAADRIEEPEVAVPTVVPMVDRLRIASLPDELFENEDLESEDDDEGSQARRVTLEDAERRALLENDE